MANELYVEKRNKNNKERRETLRKLKDEQPEITEKIAKDNI